MENQKENLKENLAVDVFQRRLHNAHTFQFMLGKFKDYADMNNNWRGNIQEYMIKFRDFVNVTDPELNFENLSVSDIIKKGILFLYTVPVFSTHEFAAMGAPLTPKEHMNFVKELIEVVNKPSALKQLYPYLAAVGYKIILHTRATEPAFVKEVEKRKQELTEEISASVLQEVTDMKKTAIEKAVMLCNKLNDIDVTIDSEGNVNDPKGRYKEQLEDLKERGFEVDEDGN